jgi:hypothetical protein
MSHCTSNEKNVGGRHVIQWVGIIAMSILACVDAMAQPPPTPSKPSLAAILTDSTLWGKDFPVALASLQSWSKAGQRTVMIFQDRIVGGIPFKSREEAEQKGKEVTDAMMRTEFKPKPGFEAMFRGVAPKPAAELKAEVIERFQDDDSVRIASTGPGAQFLAPNLTVATVRERLGQPEKVEQKVIQSEGERRPVILTLYRYADGAVTFAESDIAARPGTVDRVLLDAPAVVNAIQVK